LPAFAETSRPASEYHDNFYNDDVFVPIGPGFNPLKGKIVPGADQNFPYPTLTHFEIERSESVRDLILGAIELRIRA